MSQDHPVGPAELGWCSKHTDVHRKWSTCVDFESDADFIKRLTAESAEHDRNMAGYAEARYVEQHRPY